jgi:hypothetical protein
VEKSTLLPQNSKRNEKELWKNYRNRVNIAEGNLTEGAFDYVQNNFNR